jgi:ribose transport system ATP-binding protein
VVGSLSPALQTGIAVARALRSDDRARATLLVLDEPTATLPENDVRQLLDMVRTVASAGVGVLYVTHRIDEVLTLADQATVLRDGRKVAARSTVGLDRRSLVTMLVGREFDEVQKDSRTSSLKETAPILVVRDLTAGSLRNVSFAVAPGEVVGVAGLTGSGREDLLGAVFGRIERQSGSVAIGGTAIPPLRPDVSIGEGMAFLPSERRTQSGIMEQSARENLTLANLRPFWQRLRMRRRPEVAESKRWFNTLSVRPRQGVEEKLANFSGGNQQKVLFGKWLRIEPRILLLDEPTQGVDVATKSELHQHILHAAQGGVAVLVGSSDVEELVAISSRILVVRDGEIASQLEGDDITQGNIAHESFGSGWAVKA